MLRLSRIQLVAAVSALLALTLVGGSFGVNLAHAGGLEGKGIGSRQIGMGSASIGVADDWASIYWNPAGLAFLDGSEMALELHMIFTEQRTSASLKNIDNPLEAEFLEGDFVKFGATAGVEPDRFGNTTMPAIIPTPDFVWYKNFGHYTIATGLYGSSGTGARWDDKLDDFEGTDTITGDIEIMFVTMTVPLAVAFKLNDRLSVGVNLGLVFGYNSRHVEKRYQSTTDPSRNMEFLTDASSRGFGVSMAGGVLLKITPALHAGVSVRAPYALYNRGNSRFVLGSEESDTLSSTTHQPMTAGVGLSYRPTSQLILAADAYWVKHSDFKTVTKYDHDGHTFMSDGVIDWNLRNTWQFRLGAEYQPTNNLTLRVGGLRDPSPYRADAASLATPRFNHATMLTAGVGYAWNSLQVDIGYQHGLVSERQGNGISMSGAVQIASLGALYKF